MSRFVSQHGMLLAVVRTAHRPHPKWSARLWVRHLTPGTSKGTLAVFIWIWRPTINRIAPLRRIPNAALSRLSSKRGVYPAGRIEVAQYTGYSDHDDCSAQGHTD